MKKNLLFITQHLPYPPHSGARRREYELLKHLSIDNNVTLLAISKVFNEDSQMMQHMGIDFDEVYLYPANNEISISDANAINTSVQVHRNKSQQASQNIAKIIEKHHIEVIHIEGFYMWYILPKELQVPVVLCEQNIEYDIWKQQVALHPEDKEDYATQVEIVKREEQHVWKNVSKIITVTSDDARIIQNEGIADVSIVSNGYDHTPWLCNTNIDSNVDISNKVNNLLFVGNFDYKPNEDAAFYFAKEIYPSIKKIVPNCKVYFVGNIGKSSVKQIQSKDICVTGRVDNLAQFYKMATLFICPLRFGGGIKTKILEALYASKAIVTTSIGLQGISADGETPFIIADTSNEFSNAIIDLLTNDSYRLSKELLCSKILTAWTTWKNAANKLSSVYIKAIEVK